MFTILKQRKKSNNPTRQESTLINQQPSDKSGKNRRLIKVLSVFGLIVVGVCMLIQIIPYIYFQTLPKLGESSDVAIIGGADGPTSITLASSEPYIPGIIILISILVLSIIGLYFSRKNKQK